MDAGVVANFLVESAGGGNITTQTAGTPFDIKITARDANNNVANFNGTANITSSGTLSSGSGATASFSSGVLSAHSVTISNTGLFTITATRTGGAETGVSNTFTVQTAPIVATKFIIESDTTATVGNSVLVTVKAVDNSNNTDSTFQNDVTLLSTGAATGAGLVDIVNGVGTINISNTSAQTVTLSLSDTELTGLDVSATHQITWSIEPVIIVSGGGSSAVSSASSISFSGQAFPSGLLTAFAISEGTLPIKQDTVERADGKFDLNFNSKIAGSQQYGIFVVDNEGRQSQAKIYTIKNGVPDLTIQGLVMSPTVGLLREALSKGDFLSISGYAVPKSSIEFEIDGKIIDQSVTAGDDGSYKILWNTVGLDFGRHIVRIRQVTKDGLTSEFSPTKSFNLTRYIITPTDFNSDGKIDLRDTSIFLSLWYNNDNSNRSKIDLNKDGKVDLQDLSAFLRTIKK